MNVYRFVFVLFFVCLFSECKPRANKQHQPSVKSTGSPTCQPLKDRVLEDLLDSGAQASGKTFAGRPVKFLFKRFFFKGQEITALVVTKITFEVQDRDSVFERFRPVEKEAYYDADTGRWHGGLRPTVCFSSHKEVPKKKRFRVEFLMDCFTSGVEDAGYRFDQKTNKAVVPWGLTEAEATKIEEGELTKRCSQLYAAYEKKFFKQEDK